MTIVARDLDHLDRGDEALAMLHQALAIEERAFGPVHPQVASTLNELGTVALSHGQLHEAEADFSRMADIYRTVYHGKQYRIGIAWSNLGSVYLAEHRYAAAEQRFRDAIAMLKATLPAGHVNTGIATIKLGRALLRQGRYREAVQASLAGYAMLKQLKHPPTSWLDWARKDLAEDYEALGEQDEAARFRSELTDTAAPHDTG
jgi:serine/threonine-protein kinase